MDLFNPHFVPAKGGCGTVTHSPGCKSLNILDHVIGYQLQEQTSAFFSESFTELPDSIEFIERPLKSNTVKTTTLGFCSINSFAEGQISSYLSNN